MRPMLLLAATVAVAACTETGGPLDDDGQPIGGQAATIRVSATSQGPDIDPDGYRVTVDGEDRGALPANGSATIELAPGRRTIALADVASNCVVDGPPSRTVDFGAGEVVPLAFLVSCADAMPDPSPVSDLAFVSGADIYVARADGSNVRRLTTDGFGRPHYSPAWSPDGTRLAFMRYESSGRFAIWVMNADGSGAIQLSRGDVDDFRPTWSPDGRRIAFESLRDSTGYGGVNAWLDAELYVMNADGTNPVRLTHHLGHQDLNPAWSPDGSRIAYVSDSAAHDQIYLIKPDGTDPVQVTSDQEDHSSPAWSPDGNRIAFVTVEGLAMVNADGTDRVFLGPVGGGPAWSPDGRTIAYTRSTECRNNPYGDCYIPHVWLLNIDRGTVGQWPLRSPTSSHSPSWRP